MRPEEVARYIQIGLDTRYMVIASAATPGKIMSVCPARCALAKDMRQRRPDLVVVCMKQTSRRKRLGGILRP